MAEFNIIHWNNMLKINVLQVLNQRMIKPNLKIILAFW